MEDGPWMGDPDNPISLVWGEEVAPALKKKKHSSEVMYEDDTEDQEHEDKLFDIIDYMKDNDDYDLDAACENAGISPKRLTREDIRYVEEKTYYGYESDITSIVDYMTDNEDYNLNNACEYCGISRSCLSKRDIAEIEEETGEEIEL